MKSIFLFVSIFVIGVSGAEIKLVDDRNVSAVLLIPGVFSINDTHQMLADKAVFFTGKEVSEILHGFNKSKPHKDGTAIGEEFEVLIIRKDGFIVGPDKSSGFPSFGLRRVKDEFFLSVAASKKGEPTKLFKLPLKTSKFLKARFEHTIARER